jgi:hypothetical protein
VSCNKIDSLTTAALVQMLEKQKQKRRNLEGGMLEQRRAGFGMRVFVHGKYGITKLTDRTFEILTRLSSFSGFFSFFGGKKAADVPASNYNYKPQYQVVKELGV